MVGLFSFNKPFLNPTIFPFCVPTPHPASSSKSISYCSHGNTPSLHQSFLQPSQHLSPETPGSVWRLSHSWRAHRTTGRRAQQDAEKSTSRQLGRLCPSCPDSSWCKPLKGGGWGVEEGMGHPCVEAMLCLPWTPAITSFSSRLLFWESWFSWCFYWFEQILHWVD